MTIKILNESIINKIAAGEVVLRPANAIKELIENSIDARSDDIKIEIENAGLKRIRISDNGIGMDRDDLLLCCRRHTTSKIEKETDLNKINSLGFRGEALSSIAEISHLKIKSKTKNNEVGNFLEIEGGIKLSDQKVGCSNGTIIEIIDLFYNVPARKNFLKSPEVELAHIIDIVTRYALIKKEISIKLTHNGKEIINSPKTDNQLNNIICIYGSELTRNLIEVNFHNNRLKIEGYISKPSLTRANKNEQSLFINSRYVKNTQISDAIYSAYNTLLFTNRHPIYILNLIINPEEIDVNIHPNKLNVRLKSEQEICEDFFLAIKDALSNQVLMPISSIESETTKKPLISYELKKDVQSNLFVEDKENNEDPNLNRDNQENKPHPSSDYNPFTEFRILGQINRTYIIAENNQGIAIIDQHAAEERVNYERFLNELTGQAIKKQGLIEPKIIKLNPSQYHKAISNKIFITKLGFDFEDFGDTTIKLNSTPEIFGREKTSLFIDIINELTTLGVNLVNQEIEERIIRFACRKSVKAGDELTFSEIKELIQLLGKTTNPYSCPHGRPTVIQLTNADLEKKFKRSGW
jgi:DNA mismatch repair protein MutL